MAAALALTPELVAGQPALGLVVGGPGPGQAAARVPVLGQARVPVRAPTSVARERAVR
jgi:hypothetical protein